VENFDDFSLPQRQPYNRENIERTASVRGPSPRFSASVFNSFTFIIYSKEAGAKNKEGSSRNPSFKFVVVQPCYLSFPAFLYIPFAFALYK